MRYKFIPNPVRIEDDIAHLTLFNRAGEEVAEALIDTDDLGRVLAAGRWYPSWNKLANAYYVMNNRLRTSLHRFVMNAQIGEKVDHIYHDTLDCRKSELRLCTHAENMQNRRGAHKQSKSGVRNVYWRVHKGKGRWVVEVRANRIKHFIGHFDDLEEAKQAAEGARRRLHGEFAA